MMSLYTIVLVTPALGYLCWSDYRRRLLPNAWTMGLLLAALAWRLGWGGLPLLMDGVWGCLVAACFMMLPFLLRASGGGDVKFLAACGAVTGLVRVPVLLMYTSVCGLVLALVFLLMRKATVARFKHYFLCLFWWRYDRQAARAKLPDMHSEENMVPFGIAIAAGTWLTLLASLWQGGFQ
jgi:prepilin peptidase CpaA